MLQDIRANVQGTAAKIVVGLIVVSFSLFGIESILLGGSGGGVAEVNGEEVSPEELQQAVTTQTRRLIAMMGQNFDPALLDENRIQTQALEGLIGRKLLNQSVEEMGLALSEAEIGAQVGSMEQFQIDGRFDADLYKRVLSDRGFTPGYFKKALSEDIMVAQVRSGLAGSEFATPTEIELNAAAIGEQRDFRYLTIPGDAFRAEQSPSADAVEAHYAEHQSEYMTEESVDVQYLELQLDDFREPVAEEAIVEAYETAAQAFSSGTENRLSHILLTGDDAEVAERLAQLQSRLAEGADFAELAAEFSDDIGSASRGGDLGYSSGDTFPEAIENEVAGLEPGQVSAPIVTDDGTHLVMLTERRQSEAPTLADMRLQLEQSIQSERARAELLRTVETLRDLSFIAEDLEGPAAELDLTLSEARGVTRTAGTAALANPRLRNAAFSEEVLVAGHNSEVFELPGEVFVVLRVLAHHEPQVRPLDEVRDAVVESLVDAATREAVAQEANRLIGELREGNSLEALANAAGYEWQVELGARRDSATSVSPQVLARVFELSPPQAEPVTEYVLAENGDAVVVELVVVATGSFASLPAQEQAELRQRILREAGMLIDSEYQQGLREAAEIVVL